MVGLTVRETRISNMSEGQNQLRESQTKPKDYYSTSLVGLWFSHI